MTRLDNILIGVAASCCMWIMVFVAVTGVTGVSMPVWLPAVIAGACVVIVAARGAFQKS